MHTGNKTAHKVAHLVVYGTTWQLIFKHTRGGMYLDIVMSMLPHRLVHVGQDAKVLTICKEVQVDSGGHDFFPIGTSHFIPHHEKVVPHVVHYVVNLQ